MPKYDYTYKFRAYPNATQIAKLAKIFGACRFVYNYFLRQYKQYHKISGECPVVANDQENLDKLRQKESYAWLNEVDYSTLHGSIQLLGQAVNRYKLRTEGGTPTSFPTYRKRKDRQQFTSTCTVKIRHNRLEFLGLPGGLKIKLHRPVCEPVKRLTVTLNRAGQYYVHLIVSKYARTTIKAKNTEIGLDLGLSHLVTCSDGTKLDNIRPFKILEHKVRLLKRILHRTKPNSKGRERARIKLARVQQKIVNTRNDYLHKISHTIVRDNQAIYMEDLNVAGMARNRKITSSLLDAALAKLCYMIKYKGNLYSRLVCQVPRNFPSSKTCSECGHKLDSLSLSTREWNCPDCNTTHDRDINAARNILAKGKTTVGTTGVAGRGKRKPFNWRQFLKKPEIGPGKV